PHRIASDAREDGRHRREARARVARSACLREDPLVAGPRGRGMTTAALAVLVVLGIALVIPAAVLYAECVAALLPDRTPGRAETNRTAESIVVLIPAHDEAKVLSRTLAGVLPELAAGDRVLVVADNCTDDTAAIARAAGAEVLERDDPRHRGKGFALDAGI